MKRSILGLALVAMACGGEGFDASEGGGDSGADGETSPGGSVGSTGGASSGGVLGTSGGALGASGGARTGGAGSGGVSSGGASLGSGGASSGGVSSGGTVSTGGSDSGAGGNGSALFVECYDLCISDRCNRGDCPTVCFDICSCDSCRCDEFFLPKETVTGCFCLATVEPIHATGCLTETAP